VLHVKGKVIDTVDNVYDRDWSYDVVAWLGLGDPEKVTLPQFLRQPALIQHYPATDDIKIALGEMITFGHEGVASLASKEGRRNSR